MRAAAVVTALLLLGGGTAVAVGLPGRDAVAALPAAPGSAPPSGAVPAGADLPTAAPVELPVSVEIPAIGVQSELLLLGADDDGTIAVPAPGPDHDKAAWFTGSPRPGERGAAVLEGHVASVTHGPSVFSDLAEVEVGDQVEVTRADGTMAGFTVYAVRVVPGDRVPTLAVDGSTRGPELRLITRGGRYDAGARGPTGVVVSAR
ncbi:sortase domain-bontaining protein [Modestobacter sp. SSW1-42]|uniref:sortase domain-containing protein n=1 Tax=Modestobacter sp. SSW1-42 TaxID=596372 RepID=UPI003986F045